MKVTAPVSDRKRVALITNHGYAGPKPPIGNAPDTGGQNVYVNDLAHALEEVGYEVFIFTRGGFPEYRSEALREGEAQMDEFIRYVYIPGGGNEFIPKESIAGALGEQAENLYAYINRMAELVDTKPWQVFDFINSHYWDGGVLGYDLVERWQADFIFERLHDIFNDTLKPEVMAKYYRERHVRAVRHNWQYLFGRLVLKSYDVQIELDDTPVQIHEKAMGALEQIDGRFSSYAMTFLSQLQRTHWPVFTINKTTIAAVLIGHLVADFLAQIGALRSEDIFRLNRHFWTPHSLGPIKEINYLDYGWEKKRGLNFMERKHEERVVCERTPLIVSTSKDISKTLVANYNVHPDRIIYFPPCVNAEYRPRPKETCDTGYRYLSEKSGVPVETLRASRIIIEASRADRTKRKDLILQAFKEAQAWLDDAYLFIFGGPKNDIFDELATYIHETGEIKGRAFLIPETVEFTALVEIFSLASLYVSASEMEGFGMSVLQAAASGVPVVSSSFIPFASMHLKEIANIVPTQEPADYAREMKAALADPKAYARTREDLIKSSAAFSWRVRVKDLHTAEHEPTIIFAEHALDNYVIRLGEDTGAELMVTAAHIHRGGRFIKDRPINILNGTLRRNSIKSTG